MAKFDQFAFSADPAFDEAQTRKAFSKAVPLKTLVIYCYDPRAAEIPNAVAKLFGDEVFPGKVILDSSGSRVASSTTILPSLLQGAHKPLPRSCGMAPKPLERTLVRRSPVSGAMREMGQKLGYQAWVIVRYGLNRLIQTA